MQIVANKAHEAAEKILSGWNLPFPMTDYEGCARVAASADGINPDSREGETYIERFIGHVINVQCGTKGF